MKINEPFIKTIRSPRNYYFYDVNRDTIVQINRNIYDYLNKKNEFDVLPFEDQLYINKLLADGYLSSKHFTKIEHPNTKDLDYQLANRCEQLILQVTQSCNLVCYYCPYANKSNGILQRDHSNKMMSWEIAKSCIDFYAAHSSDNEDANIGFYGGEPLIAFDLIKKCVEYIEDSFLGKDIHFGITTNGTLVTDEIIAFFHEHNFNITFSIDGPKSVHDVNRKSVDGSGSFDSAINSMKRLVEKYGNQAKSKISINMVFNPVNDVDEVISLFNDPFFMVNPINVMSGLAEDDFLEKDIKITEAYQAKMRYQYFLGFLDYLNIVDGLKISPPIKSYFYSLEKAYLSYKNPSLELPDVGAPGGPCIPGQRRIFSDVNGVFYPCERVSEVSEVMKIGDIRQGFNLKKAKAILNIGQITSEECINCFAAIHCKLCARVADDFDRFSAKKKLQHCSETYTSFIDELKNCILIKESRTEYKKAR